MADDTISVIGTKKGLVGLWEIDPAHPGGEAFVTDKKPADVAETALVLEALAGGRLRKATSADNTAAEKADAAAQKAAAADQADANDQAAADKAAADAQAAADKSAADAQAAADKAAADAKAKK